MGVYDIDDITKITEDIIFLMMCTYKFLSKSRNEFHSVTTLGQQKTEKYHKVDYGEYGGGGHEWK